MEFSILDGKTEYTILDGKRENGQKIAEKLSNSFTFIGFTINWRTSIIDQWWRYVKKAVIVPNVGVIFLWNVILAQPNNFYLSPA